MKKNLLIKGGLVIDPNNGYHSVKKDILIEEGVFKEIADTIEVGTDMEVLLLNGEYVSPGFIDVHAHVYTGVALGVDADEIGINLGTTTVIDAGSAGPVNMKDFIERDIKKNKTRIYCAMHFAKDGLLNPPEADQEDKYDSDLSLEAYETYKNYIVAIKARASKSCVGDYGITPIKAAKSLARSLNLPIMVHIGNMPPTIEEVLNIMEKDDIITHAFHGKANNLFDNGQIKPETQAARNRGVLFDIGHGKDSFNFSVGRLAKSLGFYPDLAGTDLHSANYKGPVYSQAVTLDKMLALGYDLETCIDKVTGSAAKSLNLDKLGKIIPGCYGDLTIFTLEEGNYEYIDSDDNKLAGTQSICVTHTVLDGEIVMSKA